MSDQSEKGGYQCDECDNPEGEVRPVMVHGIDAPVLTCATCCQHLDKLGKIDWERDAEVFGYAC